MFPEVEAFCWQCKKEKGDLRPIWWACKKIQKCWESIHNGTTDKLKIPVNFTPESLFTTSRTW